MTKTKTEQHVYLQIKVLVNQGHGRQPVRNLQLRLLDRRAVEHYRRPEVFPLLTYSILPLYHAETHRFHVRVNLDVFQAEGHPGRGRLPQDQPHRSHVIRLHLHLSRRDVSFLVNEG